jgi:hypothetical protein
MSGRKVDLNIYVRAGDEDRCAYAMDSLIRSMRWDEQVYGRDYDLDRGRLVTGDGLGAGRGLGGAGGAFATGQPGAAAGTEAIWGNGSGGHTGGHGVGLRRDVGRVLI